MKCIDCMDLFFIEGEGEDLTWKSKYFIYPMCPEFIVVPSICARMKIIGKDKKHLFPLEGSSKDPSL